MKPFLFFVLFVCAIFSCQSAGRSTDTALDLSENVEKYIDVVGALKNDQKQINKQRYKTLKIRDQVNLVCSH